MKLYEFEGHKLLNRVGIESPFFVVCESLEDVQQAKKRIKFPVVSKVQVLSGKRGKSGGIKICTTGKQLNEFIEKHFGKDFNGEEVRFITLAQKVDIREEYYLSITYDTVSKLPYIMFSSQGGMDIEEIAKTNSESIIKISVDPVNGPSVKELKKQNLPEDVVIRLWDAFTKFDCRLIEINPLALVKSHPRGEQEQLVAVDAKVILDDSGLARHKDLDILPKGAISAIPTERELLAKQIDAEDYRGTAGSTFIELNGDIAILASGGGASLLVMDSVVAAGGVCANYTEYSGNPPGEKVEKLTKIALDKEELAGCLVAGAVANFTDIYETLSGFMRGLQQVNPKPEYPIVIRRGGPRQKEAYEMIEKVAKKEGYDIHLFGPGTPISVASRKMVELAKQYAKSKGKS